MNVAYLYLLNCFLIPRFFFQWNEAGEGRIKNTLQMAALEIFLLIPLLSLRNLPIYLIFLLIYHEISILLIGTQKNPFGRRIIELVYLILSSGFVMGIFLPHISLNEDILGFLRGIVKQSVLLGHLEDGDFDRIVLYTFGLLILTGEINNVVRYILGKLKTVPQSSRRKETTPAEPERVDEQQLKRGKIIGMIERTLFFFFVISGNYASIAFILTAKGFTRFRELNDKNFAEYVLIGTLLSSSLAIFWATFIQNLNQGL